jgi:hypothetical protein
MGYSVNFIRLRATNNVVLRHHHRRVRAHDPMEADTRLLVARQQAAAAADRNTALALRKALKEFVECGVALDETLVAIGEEGHAVREAASKLHHGVVKVAKAIVAGARTGAVSEFELAAAVGRQHLSDRMR